MPPQLVEGDVHADVDVAHEPDERVVEEAVQGVPDGAHLRVVGRDAVPDQPERRGQPVDQVDGDRDVVLAGERVGGVDARRPGAARAAAPRWAALRRRGRGGTVGGHAWHPDPAGARAPEQRPERGSRPDPAAPSVAQEDPCPSSSSPPSPRSPTRSTPCGRRSWPPSRRCTPSPAASSTRCTRATGAFVMVERWESPEALKVHGRAEALTTLGGALAGKLAAPLDVRRLTAGAGRRRRPRARV